MTDELKPCPFDGEPAQHSTGYSPPFVFCPLCHTKKYGQDAGGAIRAWNARTALPEVEALGGLELIAHTVAVLEENARRAESVDMVFAAAMFRRVAREISEDAN